MPIAPAEIPRWPARPAWQVLAERRQFLILMALLVALAWFTLWIWAQSPYGRYLDHGSWTEIGLAASICRALPAGDIVFPALLYVGGWVLMTAAMMLPTTLPLLETFRRLTQARPDRGRLLALVVTGYLTVWLAFGVIAHTLDWAIHAIVEQNIWLALNGWLIGALVLAVAGLFQFSTLKYRCLEQCRMPMSFVLRHWRGDNARRQALHLGMSHGAYCVGCCWALMLLMFVVGMGSVGWMLLLAAVMAIEKNLPFGRRLSTPLGVALLAGAAVLFFQNGGIPLS